MSAEMSPQTGPARRVVLIDFDWQDADLLPELVRRPELSVRLVAGQQPEDPGLRIAELCGLPRTMDLADLTREIFDLALVGERSTRRTQVEGLLQVLGTPCVTPEAFLSGKDPAEMTAPAVEAPTALHAAAFETALGGSYDAIVEQALPDLTHPDPSHEPSPRPEPAERLDSLESFPSPEDRQGLEGALAQMLDTTGAIVAEVHTGRADQIELLAQVGSEDALLRGLVELALRLDQPQVVSRLSGPLTGRAWGAWPFHTAGRHGVVAAGGIHPAERWTAWQSMVEELRTRWDARDRAQAAPAFPMVPEPQAGWLDVRDFRTRLELAVERHRRDGLGFAVHRLDFGDGEAFERAARRLADALRDTDSLCRTGPAALLVLSAHAPGAWSRVRERILALYRVAWLEVHGDGDPPDPEEEYAELLAQDGAPGFLETTVGWLPAS